VRDGVELAEFLREHLHTKKIVLAGVSEDNLFTG